MKTSNILIAILLMIFAVSAQAALNAYAELTANGMALDGDTTMATIGGVDVSSDHIEIYEIDQSVLSVGKGKAESGPILLQKRIDNTSPMLLQALAEDQIIEGHIKIFDNDPDSGETRHRFTVSIGDGRIVGLDTRLPDAFDANESNRPPIEYVRIEVQSYTLTDEINSSSWTINF